MPTLEPQAAEQGLLAEVARGVYRLENLGAADIASAERIIARYAALRVALADASIVVLAESHDVRDVLTLDERIGRPYAAARAAASCYGCSNSP